MDDQNNNTPSAPAARSRSGWKRIFVVVVVIVVALAVILVVRAAMFRSRQLAAEMVEPIQIDRDRVSAHLAEAVRFKTVSHEDPSQFDSDVFTGLLAWLQDTFPLVHQTLGRRVIGGHSVLFTWPGSDSKRKPILLMGHLDVVPVEPGAEDDWEHPPFSGNVADGYIWGRGTLDDKCSVVGLLEAAETLLEKGHQPRCTIYLAFGHDEEVGGLNGAARIAADLQSRDVEPAYVLDEGMAITKGLVPGIETPVALIGIAEKGYVSIELLVHTEGGHSSMPPDQSAVGILSAAVQRLEAHPMSSTLSGPIQDMLAFTGPEMSFPQRVVFGNLWLFGPAVERVMAASTATNAAIRTTTAATMFHAGIRENVLPSKARAVVNFRILPGDSVGHVIEHVRRTIHDDRIKVNTVDGGNEPSPISDVESPNFTTLMRTIRQIFPEATVAPSLVLGGTDSRHYSKLSSDIYRFVPYLMTDDDLNRVHGTNERISIENYVRMIRFYVQLMLNSGT